MMKNSKKSANSGKKPQQVKSIHKEEEKCYQFIAKTYPKSLNCSICKLLMVEPVRLHPCGHTFCKKCVKQPKCTRCPQKYVVIQPDLIAANMINEMSVRCLSNECPWRGTFDEYKMFHADKCKLKSGGGIQEWLRCLQQSLGQLPQKLPKLTEEQQDEHSKKSDGQNDLLNGNTVNKSESSKKQKEKELQRIKDEDYLMKKYIKTGQI